MIGDVIGDKGHEVIMQDGVEDVLHQRSNSYTSYSYCNDRRNIYNICGSIVVELMMVVDIKKVVGSNNYYVMVSINRISNRIRDYFKITTFQQVKNFDIKEIV